MASASDTRRSPAPPSSSPSVDSANVASLRALLTSAHEIYAGHPHSTTSNQLWSVLGSLDRMAARLVETGLVQSVSRDNRQGHHHYTPAAAVTTSAVLEAWLLGGCIAYSLGDMNRAIEWNVRILQVDPNYVEAMSNLAAAFRAQGRDADAEGWWTRAVHLRPAYWDAADHLFSLLCAQQRYADAAKVLNYVERHATSSTSPGVDLARYLAIIHAKGTLFYALEDHLAAAQAFSRVLAHAASGKSPTDDGADTNPLALQQLVDRIRTALQARYGSRLLLTPIEARACLHDVFGGELPGLRTVENSQQRNAIAQTTANTLLTLAKILQDAIAAGNGGSGNGGNKFLKQQPHEHQHADAAENVIGINNNAVSTSKTANLATLVQIMGRVPSTHDVLPMYYLSLALHASPSTANNIGILLASLAPALPIPHEHTLALEYYRFGLSLDPRHPHLYTNLGSLLKDQGRLADAVNMYECAVSCDPNFDIALANLANAVKDQGRVGDAIGYYRRAVAANPRFDEAVCGLANSLSSVCDWAGRGCTGYVETCGVDENSDIVTSKCEGWMMRIVEIVSGQLRSSLTWGTGVIANELPNIVREIVLACGYSSAADPRMKPWLEELARASESGVDEGAKIVEIFEAAARRARWRAYSDRYVHHLEPSSMKPFHRPRLPLSLALPPAPTVLPFHTFTIPFDAVQGREVCRRTALRVSVSTNRYSWLPADVYPPPPPPTEHLRIGYVSSDFNNHPLSHLMQSVFGLHRKSAGSEFPVYGICYATTPSDNSPYRQKIEREAHEFVDISGWSTQAVVERIVEDNIHILVNLNGFTRGARNEIFACRPAPLSISFMGFAGSLGAEWSDYILADRVAVPPDTVRQMRKADAQENKSRILRHHDCKNQDNWVYFEDIVFCKHSFFCCDHRQSAPDAVSSSASADPEDRWNAELVSRRKMRDELFPSLAPGTIILANFNQLYKIDPGVFLTWLRILSRLPNAVLWLLKFPDLGTAHLRSFATRWAGPEVANRIIFTDVASKDVHLLRCRIPDLVLDTPECNAHTTATDVIWAGTPILTFPRHRHKMCSRIAASVITSAADRAEDADRLIAQSEEEYEVTAVELCLNDGEELLQLRKRLFLSREKSPIFDTPRWTRDLEKTYWMMWNRWVDKGGAVTVEEDPDRNLYI
ncbi:glycosyl transferase family 41-domain-containing protein [Myxozyma melibiosi]|uniref:protein O-GlcNAc transferase n=1 Tax=Myxozyma melibiosi TaxID=54550 RepID=A0ABR1FA79_9ASCO